MFHTLGTPGMAESLDVPWRLSCSATMSDLSSDSLSTYIAVALMICASPLGSVRYPKASRYAALGTRAFAYSYAKLTLHGVIIELTGSYAHPLVAPWSAALVHLMGIGGVMVAVKYHLLSGSTYTKSSDG